MQKDPAVLFFIDKWLIATKEMKADCRGWYLNLILHQFDKKDLPNDIEELANLADVRVTEFPRFEQVFKDVLQQKFKANARGRLENEYAKTILKGREVFKEKREAAGKMSYFIRYVRKHLCQDENILFFVKQHVDLSKIDIKNEQEIEHLFKQTSKLFINVNTNENINIDKDGESVIGGREDEETKTAFQDHIAVQGFFTDQLKAIWLTHRPTYQYDLLKDAKPLRVIGEAIGKGEGVSAYDATGVERIKQTFDSLVAWSLTHSLFRTFQLSQFEKYFQSICLAYSHRGDGVQVEKKSTLHNNIQTAKGAADIIKNKYSNSEQ